MKKIIVMLSMFVFMAGGAFAVETKPVAKPVAVVAPAAVKAPTTKPVVKKVVKKATKKVGKPIQKSHSSVKKTKTVKK